jgi:tetratricopeptide (TPR) repeat protein
MKSTAIDSGGLELDIERSGKWIAFATTKGTKIWDRRTGTLLQDWPQDGQVWFVKFDASGATLATAGQQGILRVYKAPEGDAGNDDPRWSTRVSQPLHELKASASIHGLAMSADGTMIYTLDSPGCEVLAWNSKTGQREVVRASQAGQTGRTAELSPNGRFLALGIDRTVEIWDVESKKLVARLKGPERKILSLTFDRTGSRLFAGTVDGIITLWNLNSQEVLLSVQAHSSYVVCLAMSPDNSTLVSASFGGELKLWEGRTLTSAMARKRIIVQLGAEHANRLLVRHQTPRRALEELAKDDSVSPQIMPIVIAVLQARMEAPINLQALIRSRGEENKMSSDADYQLRAEASSLKEQIEAAIGDDLELLQNPTVDAPNHIAAAKWNTLSRSLVQKSRFNLEPDKLLPLLVHLTEGADAPHYLIYLKGIAHVNLSQWETAESELSRAIALVPPESPLWFEYAFRLSFLRAYVGKWDSYHELCADALEGFSGSTDPIVLERTAKMCLFSNQSKTDVQAAAELADRAEGQVLGGFSVYTQLTRGIADLRRKNYEKALESLNAVIKRGVQQDNVGNAITVALAKMYASIACHHLGRTEAAQQYFDESAKTINSFPSSTGWWPDWMMAVVVMKEAEELIAQGEKKSISP